MVHSPWNETRLQTGASSNGNPLFQATNLPVRFGAPRFKLAVAHTSHESAPGGEKEQALLWFPAKESRLQEKRVATSVPRDNLGAH
jgi:hypothetical protein